MGFPSEMHSEQTEVASASLMPHVTDARSSQIRPHWRLSGTVVFSIVSVGASCMVCVCLGMKLSGTVVARSPSNTVSLANELSSADLSQVRYRHGCSNWETILLKSMQTTVASCHSECARTATCASFNYQPSICQPEAKDQYACYLYKKGCHFVHSTCWDMFFLDRDEGVQAPYYGSQAYAVKHTPSVGLVTLHALEEAINDLYVHTEMQTQDIWVNGAFSVEAIQNHPVMHDEQKEAYLQRAANSSGRRLGIWDWFNNVKCGLIDAACAVIAAEGIASVAGCVSAAALAAGACEAAGGGPLDPVADACAVTLFGTFEVSCQTVVAAGGIFGVATCEAASGCG